MLRVRSQQQARSVAKAAASRRALFFLSSWCNRIAVHVDSRLHLRRRQLIPGGQHGEEEKESSGEEDQASEEEEVGVCRFEVSDNVTMLEIASCGPDSAGDW